MLLLPPTGSAGALSTGAPPLANKVEVGTSLRWDWRWHDHPWNL